MTRQAFTAYLLTGLVGLAALLMLMRGGWPGGMEKVILLHIRLPRVLLAALTGGMLGVAGTLLQTVLRNPLATPDVIGFGGGAAAGAALSIALSGQLALVLPAALAGGLLTAALVLGLAWRGGMQPLALVLIGVAVNLVLLALTDVLLSFAPGLQAGETARFLTGGFGNAHWGAVGWAALGCVLAGAGGTGLSFGITRMDMGDDTARALGLQPTALRFAAAALSAGLTALAVALTGPLPFIALLAGPMARRIAGQGGPVILHAALIGAFLALAAEWAARLPVMGTTLPAGLYTALVGGPVMFALILMSKERS